MDQQQSEEIEGLLAWWASRETHQADEPDVPVDQIALMYLDERRTKGAPSTLGAAVVARVIQECATQPHTRPARS